MAVATPTIVDVPQQLIAVIPVTVRREEIRLVMGPGINELLSTVAAQGIAPVGPWFTHHLRMDPAVFDFEIGVPVGKPVAAAARTLPGTRPAMKVAQTVYSGPYEGLPTAWAEFTAWIVDQGHATAEDLWEYYLLGPESNQDPSTWRTQLHRPLK